MIDFEASDASGHLGSFDISVHYGAGIVTPLIPLGTLTKYSPLSADYLGPDYGAALGVRGDPSGLERRPYLLTVPAHLAFPEPCCYLIRLEAAKRHVLGGGDVFSSCSYGCEGVWWNADEFTVGAGVCDPVRGIELASAAADLAALPAERLGG